MANNRRTRTSTPPAAEPKRAISRMAFKATVVEIKPLAAKMVAKKERYGEKIIGYDMEGGSIRITVDVARPSLPKAPDKPRELGGDGGYYTVKPVNPGPEPTAFVEPTQNTGEAEAAYKKRVSEQRKAHGQRVKSWQGSHDKFVADTAKKAEAEQRYAEALQRHREASEAIGQRFNDYAQLAGLGALFGGLPVAITMTPDARALGKWLPGFSPASLLPGLGEDTATRLLEAPAADLEDEDLDDNDGDRDELEDDD